MPQLAQKRKVIFLNRDGVINRTVDESRRLDSQAPIIGVTQIRH